MIPKVLVPLERLFNINDVDVHASKTDSEEDLEDCDLGTEQEPKMVRLSKDVPKDFK